MTLSQETMKFPESKKTIWYYLEFLTVQLIFFALYRYLKSNTLMIPFVLVTILYTIYISFWFFSIRGKWLRNGLSYKQFTTSFNSGKIKYLLYLFLALTLPYVFMFMLTKITFHKSNQLLSFWDEVLRGLAISLVLGLLLSVMSNHFMHSFAESQLGVTEKYIGTALIDSYNVFSIKAQNDNNYKLKQNCPIPNVDRYKCHLNILTKYYESHTPTLIGIIFSQASNALDVFKLKSQKVEDYKFSPSINLLENSITLMELVHLRSDLIKQNLSLSILSPVSSLELGWINLADVLIQSKWEKSCLGQLTRVLETLTKKKREDPLYKYRLIEIQKRLEKFKQNSMSSQISL